MKQQKQDFDDRHGKINQVEDRSCFAGFGNQLPDCGAGHLRTHHINRAFVHTGQDGQGKHEDAHTAHPMCKTAPEEKAFRQGFHIVEDTRASRCKTGNGFKQAVDIRWDRTAQIKWQSAEQGQQNPGEGDNDIALPRIHALVRHLQADERDADGQEQGNRYKQGKHASFPIIKAHHQRKKQEARLQREDVAKHFQYKLAVHERPSLSISFRLIGYTRISLKSSSRCRVVITITLSPARMQSFPVG